MWERLRELPLFFLPHPKNNHRAHLLKHPFLAIFFTLLFSFQIILNLFYSTNPQVLGFATSIYQQELIKLVNDEREKLGLAELQENPTLNKAALLKAQDMFEEDYWAHVSPQGVTPWYWFEKESYNYLVAGENLAKDFNTSAGVVAGWLASPTHKDNLLNSEFTEIGLAVVNGKLQGEETTLVVQFFGHPQPSILASTQKEKAKPAVIAPAFAAYPESQDQGLEQSVNAVILENGDLQPWGVPAQAFSALDNLGFKLSQISNTEAWGVSQKLLVASLSFLIVLLFLDTFTHLKHGLVRKSSHSFLHAGVLLVLILAVVYSSFGMVL